MIWQEPVRGGFYPKEVFALPGIDVLRAAHQSRLPRSPLSRLYGITPSMASPGAVSYLMPITPWLWGFGGNPIPIVLGEKTMRDAIFSTLPGRLIPRTVELSISQTRFIRLDQGHLLARARAVHVGRRVAVAEVLIEDGAGRLATHGTAQFAIDPVEIDDSKPLPVLETVEEAQYPTPDPHLRVMTEVPYEPEDWDERGGLDFIREVMTNNTRQPWNRLLGMRIVDVDAGRAEMAIPVTDWLCDGWGVVCPGFGALLMMGAMSLAGWTLRSPDVDLRFPGAHFDFIRPIQPAGGELVARAEVVEKSEGLLMVSGRLESRGQGLLALASGQVRLYERRAGGSRPALPGMHRLTRTVLFTDIVGSTALAARLGDSAWRALLARHDEAVRNVLRRHQGQMVKNLGDGMLATFDSASSAVACAIGLQKTLEPDGIHLRAGLHTGEIEVRPNDVSGLAVNVCSRIVDLANAGEVLVSAMVRDLLAGSELKFEDHGAHALKGLEGDWRLFAVVA